MTEQLLHIDVILVSFWSELQLERAQSQVLGLDSLLCANVRFVCDIIIGSGDTKLSICKLVCTLLLHVHALHFYASVNIHTQVVCNQTNY